MKVRVTATVEIDAQAWAEEYGIDPADVRKDVQAHLADSLQQHVDSLGVGREHGGGGPCNHGTEPRHCEWCGEDYCPPYCESHIGHVDA